MRWIASNKSKLSIFVSAVFLIASISASVSYYVIVAKIGQSQEVQVLPAETKQLKYYSQDLQISFEYPDYLSVKEGSGEVEVDNGVEKIVFFDLLSTNGASLLNIVKSKSNNYELVHINNRAGYKITSESSIVEYFPTNESQFLEISYKKEDGEYSQAEDILGTLNFGPATVGD